MCSSVLDNLVKVPVEISDGNNIKIFEKFRMSETVLHLHSIQSESFLALLVQINSTRFSSRCQNVQYSRIFVDDIS